LIKRKQKLGSSSSSICKHKSLNRCGSHIQYRVYYKDAHIRLLGLFSVFFDSLQRKKQKKGGVLVKYLFIPTRRERERPEIASKSLILFSSSSVLCDWGIEPPRSGSASKKKRKTRCRVSFLLIFFPHLWFHFPKFKLCDSLFSSCCSWFSYVLSTPFVYIVSINLFVKLFLYTILKTMRLCLSLNLYTKV
jgi:hypothetical protein